MLLQSQHEHATRELLIIAAGLSIQDPRERPLDQKDAAAAAHEQFTDPQSDFLALLNIWNAVHDQWDQLRTQGQRRKFCKQHFLSYLRMREWQDVYSQLHDALDDLRHAQAQRKQRRLRRDSSLDSRRVDRPRRHREERNIYKAGGNRLVSVFPGSALYDARRTQKSPRNSSKPSPKPDIEPAAWIVAGEIVETSQLFARTVAGIDPQWIFQLAPHCCKVTHQNPHWSASAGNVLVEEEITLHGLEVQRRKVAYGNINPKEATAIFIRSALVEENLIPEPPRGRHEDNEASARTTHRLLASVPSERENLPARFSFIEHNRKVRQKIETWQTRMRRHDLADLDGALFQFYAKHIENVSSIHELNRFLGELRDPTVLHVTEAELIGDQQLNYDSEAFPDYVPR